MRRLSRSIFVLFVVVALNASAVQAGVINDDGNPRDRVLPRIVQVVKQILELIWDPCDDGNQLVPPHP